jgi:mono/diheme cytochrome c family protein
LIRILNGGHNMPAFAGALKPAEVDALVTFLQSRKSH